MSFHEEFSLLTNSIPTVQSLVICGMRPIHLTTPNSGPELLTQATRSPSESVGATGSLKSGSSDEELSSGAVGLSARKKDGGEKGKTCQLKAVGAVAVFSSFPHFF